MQQAGWYLKRLRRMSGAEVAYRMAQKMRRVSEQFVSMDVPARDEFAQDFRFLPPFVAVVDRTRATCVGDAMRERVAVPLRRIAEFAVLEIEEGVTAREHAFCRGDQRIGGGCDEGRQKPQVSGLEVRRGRLL